MSCSYDRKLGAVKAAIEQQIWDWLPGRVDNSRVTLPNTIAVSLGLSITVVVSALARMERDGHAIRDKATGRQSGWHRGKPLASSEPVVQAPDDWTLY